MDGYRKIFCKNTNFSVEIHFLFFLYQYNFELEKKDRRGTGARLHFANGAYNEALFGSNCIGRR